jgi:hypothetical protein
LHCGEMDGRTDGGDADMRRLTVAFPNFANAPNRHKTRPAIPSTGFGPAIPAINLQQPYVFDCTATGMAFVMNRMSKYVKNSG